MQFLKIDTDTTLSELGSKVGKQNLSNVLALNGLLRTPNIGQQYANKCAEIVDSSLRKVDWQKKSTILNTFSQNRDTFEYAALMGDDSWKVLSQSGSFPGMLQLPDGVSVPDSIDTLGNGLAVPKQIYKTVMNQISTAPHDIDPSVFNDISVTRNVSLGTTDLSASNTNVFQQFGIPWGQISLYSNLAGKAIDIPVYPESVENGASATYTQMPELLYQYEPWQVYQSSGPRQCTYEFHMHRDMWTGDHRDGKLNELIRWCKAQCYPKYAGSSVTTPIVKLYVKGNTLIAGVMNDVKDTWSGPIGLDGWYLECTMSITITEVSESALSYDSMMQKSLIG